MDSRTLNQSSWPSSVLILPRGNSSHRAVSHTHTHTHLEHPAVPGIFFFPMNRVSRARQLPVKGRPTWLHSRKRDQPRAAAPHEEEVVPVVQDGTGLTRGSRSIRRPAMVLVEWQFLVRGTPGLGNSPIDRSHP